VAGISISGVSRTFGTVRAVDNVSLEVGEGEFFTLLGPSGCGKTTLLRMIAGFCELDRGEIRFGSERIDRLPAHLRDIGMVFQNYAVFPNLTVAGNVAYGLKARKVAAPEIARRVDEALALVQLQGYGGRWPHQLSGGQLQRVAIARAISVEPRFLVADEPVSMLDVSIRAGILNLLRDFATRLDIAVLYISHDLSTMRHVCSTVAVMYLGRIIEMGPADRVLDQPHHPYAQALVAAVPVMGGRVARIHTQLAGAVPNPSDLPTGCRFHPRCPKAMARCRESEPVLTPVGRAHQVACHLYD